MDTIFALASAPGKAGIAVIRLSGPRSHAAVAALGVALPPLRQAALRRLSWRGEELDQGLVLLFDPGFTGEAVAELHLHGSRASVAAVLRALSEQAGLRAAEAGEFTRRALENGRLDLAQVEGLADLIDAETEAQRKQALRVLSGAIGQLVGSWRQDLVRAAALLAATIDFVDEDVPVDVRPEVMALIDGLLASLRKEAAGAQIAERIRDGFEVAIVGVPNSGKSTLLNAIAGRQAAITSDVAGTTRDVIEVRMDINGLAVTLLDSAGLRESDDPVEKIGIERALQRATAADLRIFLQVADEVLPGVSLQPDDITVRAKADIHVPEAGNGVSGVTGQGVTELLAEVSSRLVDRSARAATVTRARHLVAIDHAITALESARTEVEVGETRAEVAAEYVLIATQHLDSLIGRVDVDSLLDEIFASFCIGK